MLFVWSSCIKIHICPIIKYMYFVDVKKRKSYSPIKHCPFCPNFRNIFFSSTKQTNQKKRGGELF